MGRPRRRQFRNSRQAGLRMGFRSGLERQNSEHLESFGVPVLYEVRKIKYLVPETLRTYTVDFELPNGILVETKGIFEASDRAKHLFIRQQYPELDIRFVFTRLDKPVCPGVKMTCREWCERYGFIYAERLIPEEWWREPGPSRETIDRLLSSPPADL